MKRIFADRVYKVERYDLNNDTVKDYGTMNGDDVHAVIKGTTYDETMDMYFPKSANYGYSVTEM